MADNLEPSSLPETLQSVRADGSTTLDVRLTLKTDEGDLLGMI